MVAKVLDPLTSLTTQTHTDTFSPWTPLSPSSINFPSTHPPWTPQHRLSNSPTLHPSMESAIVLHYWLPQTDELLFCSSVLNLRLATPCFGIFGKSPQPTARVWSATAIIVELSLSLPWNGYHLSRHGNLPCWEKPPRSIPLWVSGNKILPPEKALSSAGRRPSSRSFSPP